MDADSSTGLIPTAGLAPANEGRDKGAIRIQGLRLRHRLLHYGLRGSLWWQAWQFHLARPYCVVVQLLL